MNKLLKRVGLLLLVIAMCVELLPSTATTVAAETAYPFTYYYRSSSDYTSSEQTIYVHFVNESGTEITNTATISGSYTNSETNPTISMADLAAAYTVVSGGVTYNFANSAKIATSSSTTYANATTANYLGYNRSTNSWRYSTNGISYTSLDSAITDVWLVYTDDTISTTYDGETVDHIDIEVASTVTVTIDGIEYSAEIELEASDFVGGNATLTAWYNYNTYDASSKFYTMQASSISQIETSESSEGELQYRVNGSYPVGTMLSPVYYLLQLTKEVTLYTADNSRSVTVTVDFTSEWFWYWSTENHCPQLWRTTGGGGRPGPGGSQTSTYDQWQSGDVIDGSGLDFVLSASAEQVRVVVSKYVVDTDFNVLDVEEETVYLYEIKEAYEEDGDTENDITVVSGNLTIEAGKGSTQVTKTVDVGEYYVMEDSVVQTIQAKVADSDDAYSDYTYVTTYYGLYDEDNLFNQDYMYTDPDNEDLKLMVGNDTDTDHWVIYNVYSSATTDITVEKVWEDADNQDGIRPDSVTVELYRNGVATGNKATLNESNNWTYTFEDLALYADGTVITYTVVEEDVPDGYNVDVTGTTASGKFTVTNTHIPETIDISGTKSWDDNDDQDGKRPDSITINLLADGVKVNSTTTTETDNWAYSFTGLAKYKDGGKEIVYTIEEVDINVDGYTTKIDGNNITNSYTPETTSISVTKVWNDNDNQDGIRPNYVEVKLYANGEEYTTISLNTGNSWKTTITGLPKYSDGKLIEYTIVETTVTGYETTYSGDAETGFTVTNTHKPETTSISGTKTWEDNNDEDKMRPESITVNLYANGVLYKTTTVSADDDGNWTYSFTNLPVYASGVEIDYEIVEEAVASYTTTYDGYNITNTYTPETTSVTAIKYWNDNNNQDGLRASYSVTITGTVEGETDPVYTDTQTLSATTLSYTWTNLDVYYDNKEITYTVDETSVPAGYTAKVTGNATSGFTIINSYTPKTTSITVNKVWDDASNQDGIRPTRVVIQLLANDEVYREVRLTADNVGTDSNTWTYTFSDLPVYSNGEKITYTVNELTEIDGYESDITGDAASGYTITNTHETATTEVTVTKVWDDSNDQDGKRPTSITINLLANGTKVDSAKVEVDEDGNWAEVTFSNLDKYKDGSLITYTVTEETVEDYTTTVTGDATSGFIVTNSYTPETVTISAMKYWNDNSNQDGLRDSYEVTITGTVGEGAAAKVVYTDKKTLPVNEVFAVWTGLAKYYGGEEITYTIDETSVPKGYTAEVAEASDDSNVDWIITNTHTPETIEIYVSKEWDDDDDNDGKRPTSITVILRANGVGVATQVIEADNDGNWSYKFTNLPKYSNGTEITYTVDEVSITDYTTTYSGSVEDGFTIKNTYVPETTSITITKVWDDGNDQDGIRPDSVTIQLLADGSVAKTVTLTAENVLVDNVWQYTFNDLPVYADGQLITYSVKEVTDDLPEGYDEVNVTQTYTTRFTVTNSHTPETTEISVTKVWDDADDQDGKRPESITINLLADGEIVDYATVTAEDDWAVTFTDLPKYSNGEEIEYTITENYIDEYDSEISGDADSGYTVTNSYEPETMDIEITKNFDESDKDGEAHDSVTITLYANGVSTGKTITLSDSNNWYGTFTDLAKYEDGVEIEYTIGESKVSGNTSVITGDAGTGFTITTYMDSTINSGSSTTSSSAADDDTSETSEDSSKTTDLTTGTSEDGTVSTTSADSETESNSFNWIIPVTGVGIGVIAVAGLVFYLTRKEEEEKE